jgi:putative hemolysin
MHPILKQPAVLGKATAVAKESNKHIQRHEENKIPMQWKRRCVSKRAKGGTVLVRMWQGRTESTSRLGINAVRNEKVG